MMYRVRLAALSLLLAASSPAGPSWPAELASLRALAADHGDRLWPGYGAAPFGLLMLGPEREILLCHPTMPPGFAPDGEDETTGCARYTRPRSDLPAGLLAALPLFGPPSTIVIGPPEASGSSLPRWRSTILHEHFHQWQDALPGIFERIAALDLAGDDETGMWMLEFPFPYADPAAASAFGEASRALAAAVRARGSAGFASALGDYLVRRRALAAQVGERNWRYFEFQLWKEGVARWTEIALSRASGDAALRDEADDRERRTLEELDRPDLPARRRVAVYAMGAAEAMLLEACGPEWRERYPDLLALGPLLEANEARCGPT